MAIYPEQIRTLDPYAEYYSNNVNRLTNIVANNENCILSNDQIEVALTSASSPPLLTLSTGACIKDNVYIRFTDSFSVNMTYADFYYDNKIPFDVAGYYYLVIDYTYVKCRPPHQAAIKIIKPDDRSGFYPTSLIFLKCIQVELVTGIFQITHIYDYDPENTGNKRITSDCFLEAVPYLPTYTEGDEGRIIYARTEDKAYVGLSSSWLEIGSGGGSGSGYSGYSGLNGIDGHKGTSGYSGSRTGISGYSGITGASGYSGADPIYWSECLLNGDFEIWTEGASLPPDDWALDDTHGGSVEREAVIKHTGNYSAKLLVSSIGEYSELYQYVHETLGMIYWRGKVVTFDMWVWADTPSSVYIQVLDGVDLTGKSPYHPGDSAWHNLSVTLLVDSAATSLVCICSAQGADTVAYFDTGRFGSNVGLPGSSGYSGISGYKGDKGDKGSRGYSGYAGEAYFERNDAGARPTPTGGVITTDGLYTVHTFVSDGIFTPTVSGTVQVECWGAGGGGGGSTSTSVGGGGGGGGAYVITPEATVIGGVGYVVVSGTGGTAATGVEGGDGENSSFGAGTTSEVIAGGGGHGGVGSGSTAGHAGVAGSTGTGLTKYNGGAGYIGASVGGGGGGSGGTASNGNSATSTTGATAVTGGGNGGNGGAVHTAGSLPTTAPSGGGGGSGHISTGVSLSGAAGLDGKVIIRYLTSSQVSTYGYIYPTTITDNLGLGTDTPLSRLSVLGGVHIGGNSDVGTNNLAVEGSICGLYKEIIVPSSRSIISTEVTGNIINNFGQSTSTVISLPTCAMGMSFVVILGTTNASHFRILPGVSDAIYLNGLTTGDGKYVQTASALRGSVISFISFQTGGGAGTGTYDWFATVINGVWTSEA